MFLDVLKRLSLFFFIFLLIASSQAADWPMWRYDSARTAASPDNLPNELTILWIRQYSPRQPAWPDPLNLDLMGYDKSFEPIVMGNRLFLGFNDSDKIVALDTKSGKLVWEFYADGPVRLPPVAFKQKTMQFFSSQKVIFASDDGTVYCLYASNGQLLWKRRLAPSGDRILGNKRLISVWPVRGGPVVDGDRVYVTSGIWPFMGIFIYCIDADTGQIVWKNDSVGSIYINQPHSSPAFAGPAPQGAIVLIEDKLLIPAGRSVPACFDAQSGRLLYYHLAENQRTGGAFTAANEKFFFNHHRDGLNHLYDLATGKKLIDQIGKTPVITKKEIYIGGDNIKAYKTDVLNKTITDTDKLSALWSVEVNASDDLIKAGSRLYAAGGGEITAVEPARRGKNPKIAWTKNLDAHIYRLIAADNKLFAVTADGRIIAFARGLNTINIPSEDGIPVYSSISAQNRVEKLLTQTPLKTGYALVYSDDGPLLEALIENTQFHIIAVVSDAEKLQNLRRRFDRMGHYGKRIALYSGDVVSFLPPQYLASLIVCDSVPQQSEPQLLQKLFDSVHPCGGVAVFPLSIKDSLENLIQQGGLPTAQLFEIDDSVLLKRPDRLPGSADWTGQYGNTANTIKSDDKLVKLPLGLLWFGQNSNLDILPRHGHGPPEQIIGHRLFIEGMDSISARDIYTGQVLWKVRLPKLNNFGSYYDASYEDAPTSTKYNQKHIPGANARGTNFIATEDYVYVIEDDKCRLLDASTGSTEKTFSLPPLPDIEFPDWGYIGVYHDFLLAGSGSVSFSQHSDVVDGKYDVWTDFDRMSSKSMVIMNRHTGRLLWQFDSEFGFIHNSIIAADDMIFCLDKLPPYIENKLTNRGQDLPHGYRMLGLDAESGRIVWQRTENVFGSWLSFSEEHNILIQATRPSRDMLAGEEGVRIIAHDPKNGSIIWDKEITYTNPPILHGDKIITADSMFSLLTGERIEDKNPITGKIMSIRYSRNHGCNYNIASEHLITFRSAAAGFYDLDNFGGTGNFGGFKSGCTSNLIAAGGVLNAPDYTRTCSCSYQNQTSLALVHDSDVEVWTTVGQIPIDGPIMNLGVNFAAPGDRRAENGTLWLEYPAIGGPSPDLPVAVVPQDFTTFQAHSSNITAGPLKWVNSSGMEGIREINIKIAEEPDFAGLYTVRLYFAEPSYSAAGKRIFDIAIQGQKLLADFDIFAQTGSKNCGIVKEFTSISVKSDLKLEFAPSAALPDCKPIICGLEIINQNAPK